MTDRLYPGRPTPPCDLSRCDIPILPAGIGCVSRWELATAVASAGGNPTLGMAREAPDLIEREVRAPHAAPDRPLPHGACHTWTVIYVGVDALKTDLEEYMRQENDMLFQLFDSGAVQMVDLDFPKATRAMPSSGTNCRPKQASLPRLNCQPIRATHAPRSEGATISSGAFLVAVDQSHVT
jgi:NAD(P)H-dependent flavin oxidoreductase YrpB (nitropropane dioxygenase family)